MYKLAYGNIRGSKLINHKMALCFSPCQSCRRRLKSHIFAVMAICGNIFTELCRSLMGKPLVASLFIITATNTFYLARKTRACLGRVAPRPRSVYKSNIECSFLSRNDGQMTWRSRSMTSIFNTCWENPKMHIWCKFGDSSSKPLQVITQTSQIS